MDRQTDAEPELLYAAARSTLSTLSRSKTISKVTNLVLWLALAESSCHLRDDTVQNVLAA